MTNNGTLDTRASQYLVREEVISAKQEYGRFNPKKISGGNAIWITNIPPNVKVWYSTDNNFEHKQRLDYMNRGTRYSTIGQQGQTQLFDNFYIFTEGTADEDILINVASSGDAVTPILSSNTNQIDQVDAVGKIGTLESINSLSPQVIAQIAKAVQGVYYKPPIHTIKIQGEINSPSSGTYIVLPLSNKIEGLSLSNNIFYKIEMMGHFDVGEKDSAVAAGDIIVSAVAHFCLFNNTNGAILTKSEQYEFNNLFKTDKRIWADEKSDLFDIYGLKYTRYYYGGTAGYTMSSVFESEGFNTRHNFIIKGEVLNGYENFGLCATFLGNNALNLHSSILFNIYEMETYDSIVENKNK